MKSQDAKTLLILGHGSSKHPDSSMSVRRHAELLRASGRFSQVMCAFLKEEPFLEQVWSRVNQESLVVVPDFLAEGYFTQFVIPKLLGGFECCPPVGTHPMLQRVIQSLAENVLADWSSNEVCLLVVGHGSTKNKHSKDTLLAHLAELKKRCDFTQIEDVWLEEEPRVSDWKEVVGRSGVRKVIVVPFLLSDGQHGGWDIPEMLNLPKGAPVHGVTHELSGGWQLRITPAVGSSDLFAEVILNLAEQGGRSAKNL